MATTKISDEAKAARDLFGQTTNEAGALAEQMSSLMADIEERREALDKFASIMSTDAIRQIALAVRAARKAVGMVAAAIAADCPDPDGF